MGNYIMSEGCKLDEKKKYKLIYMIGETETKLIQGGTPVIVCLDLANKISQIVTK